MLNYLLLTIYCLLFTLLTWKRLHWGLFLLFLLLPTYLIRFNLGPLPTTLLEVMIWIIFVVWLNKYRQTIVYSLWSIVKKNKLLFIGISLFLISATISLFFSTNLRSALGEWKAFYVEPILLFIILITSNKQSAEKQSLISNFKFQISKCFPLWQRGGFERSEKTGCVGHSAICNLQSTIIFALILTGLVTSLLAIYQHFTGFLVPYAFWQNQNTFRVTAWYGFPNAVGLFLTPLIPLSIYLAKQSWNQIKLQVSSYKFQMVIFVSCLLFLLSSLLAIIYSKGTGPLLGAITGIALLLLIHKKTRWPTITLGFVSLVCLVSLPQFSNVKNEILSQDRSGQIRLTMWQDTLKFLGNHPMVGAGLAAYQQKIIPYHSQVNGENIEIFHHPHNIFLTMWVNLGLLGLISFILIVYSLLLIPYSLYKQNTIKPFNHSTIYLLASLITILIMGLVDSPYIKNDLAILFWLLPTLLIINNSQDISALSTKISA